MSASIVYANAKQDSSIGPGDLIGARLHDLDKRIRTADRVSSGGAELPDRASLLAAKNAAAVSPRDKLNNLADRVARLAEADDRTVRLSEEATASPAAASSRHSPRLAELIKQKRAEIDSYETVPATLDWNSHNSFRSADSLGRGSFSGLHLNGSLDSHATAPGREAQDLFATGTEFPSLAPSSHGAAETSVRGHVPPMPPAGPEEPSQSLGSRLAGLREEGLSSGLYGFGVGLGIALVSGAALYVVLRLV